MLVTANGIPVPSTLTNGTQRSQITDGVTDAAVLPANTAADPADPALVVALSPNTPVPLTGAVTAGQGAAAALSGAWPVEITDGALAVAVKPSSTAPLATDPALVVTLSPNSAPITANSDVAIVSPVSSFGEVLSVPPTPITQGAFVYNINPDDWQTITYGAGSGASAAGGILSLASGTGAAGYALVQSLRTVVYRPGQGVLARIAALFSTGTVGHRQLAGIGNPESGYYFGYVDDVFGILYVESGTRAIQTLTIATRSSTAENVAVTLDGTTVLVPVTNAASANTTSYEIAKADYSQCGANGWDAQALDGVVTFVARQCNAVVGTVSVTGSTIVGVGAVVTAPTANSETFTPQVAWNGSPLQTPLDPTKVNVFSIGWQYGGGDAFFSVEEKTTGRFVLVHTIRNANSRTTPTLQQPSSRVQWVSRNAGVASSVTVKGLSASAFLEGVEKATGRVFSASSLKSGTANVVLPILSLAPLQAYQGRANAGQARAASISVSCNGAKPTTFQLVRNAVLGTAPNYAPINLNTSYSAVDIASTTVSGGVQLLSFTLNKDGNLLENVQTLSLVLDVGQTLSITSLSTANNDVAASITWSEE